MVMGKKSRDKGAAYERWLSRRWAGDLWPSARRGILQCRDGGEAADVEGTPFHVEAKDRKSHSVPATMKQAEEASDGRTPVAVLHYHGEAKERSLVVMRLGAWEELVRRAGMGGEW